jgi:alanine racemase
MTPLPKGRPTFCTINLAALRHNFHQARTKVGPAVKILSVVKANAYGHGAVKVAKALVAGGSDGFGVATLEEAMKLRAAGIRSPILVLAGIYPEQCDELVHNRLTPAICELGMLERLERFARKRGVPLPFHLKVDTGMGRIGLLAGEIDSWLSKLKELKALKFQGIFSHLSHAESVQGDYTQQQLALFQKVIGHLREGGYRPEQVHLANSAALISLPQSHFSMARPGIMLYGVRPSPEMSGAIDLQPVLSWKSAILQLKTVSQGSSISYGQTFVTQRESKIASLPVGYADGYHRLLSNRGCVLIRGQRAPIVGRVCMDLTMVDVTDIAGVEQGDEVVLLGRQGVGAISADEMARWAETISYEIFTSISARVPRIHYNSEEE